MVADWCVGWTMFEGGVSLEVGEEIDRRPDQRPHL